jgi:hypothetical protein
VSLQGATPTTIEHQLTELRGAGSFLSEEGIRDREWYKHKGTAPGKWLGYGATTVRVCSYRLFRGTHNSTDGPVPSSSLRSPRR